MNSSKIETPLSSNLLNDLETLSKNLLLIIEKRSINIINFLEKHKRYDNLTNDDLTFEVI